LTRPTIRRASARRKELLASADAGVLRWRSELGALKAAYDGLVFIFNHIKIYTEIIFPSENLYLYGVDDFEGPHSPRLPRHCGGAFARAETAAAQGGTRKSRKNAEQLCCRRPELRQSQGRRRPAWQPQCAAPRPAFEGLSGTTQSGPQVAGRRARTAHQDLGSHPGHESTSARTALASGICGCEGRTR
jgi:hypothetical protein